jgi:IS5 family transposase
MKQRTLAMMTGFERYTKKTRRAAFLEEMEQVVPWAELCSLIEPYYPTGRLASSLCCRSLVPSSCEPKSFAAGLQVDLGIDLVRRSLRSFLEWSARSRPRYGQTLRSEERFIETNKETAFSSDEAQVYPRSTKSRSGSDTASQNFSQIPSYFEPESCVILIEPV